MFDWILEQLEAFHQLRQNMAAMIHEGLFGRWKNSLARHQGALNWQDIHRKCKYSRVAKTVLLWDLRIKNNLDIITLLTCQYVIAEDPNSISSKYDWTSHSSDELTTLHHDCPSPRIPAAVDDSDILASAGRAASGSFQWAWSCDRFSQLIIRTTCFYQDIPFARRLLSWHRIFWAYGLDTSPTSEKDQQLWLICKIRQYI